MQFSRVFLGILLAIFLIVGAVIESCYGVGLCLSLNYPNLENRSKSKIDIVNFQQLYLRLQVNNDTVHIVNFWATWCGPCVEELPVFNELANYYARRKLKILLVSLDMPDSLTSLENFVQKQGLKPEVILLDEPDFDSWINKVSPQWQGSLPATIIYQGKQRELLERKVNLDEMKKKLDKML